MYLYAWNFTLQNIHLLGELLWKLWNFSARNSRDLMHAGAMWLPGSMSFNFLLQYDPGIFFRFVSACMVWERLSNTPQCSNGVQEFDEQTRHLLERRLYVAFSLGALLSGECWQGNYAHSTGQRFSDICVHTEICCMGVELSFQLKVMFMVYKIVQQALPMHKMNFVRMCSEPAWQPVKD